MHLYPQESEVGKPVKFKLQGFPEEAAVAGALERFYRDQSQLSRSFEIYNMFDELIFTGQLDEHGKVNQLNSLDRRESKRVEDKD